jgi:hypothetical protein
VFSYSQPEPFAHAPDESVGGVPSSSEDFAAGKRGSLTFEICVIGGADLAFTVFKMTTPHGSHSQAVPVAFLYA